MDNRARLTITDIIWVVIAVFAVSGLYPAYNTLFQDTASSMDPTTTVAFQLILPVALVVLLAIIFAEATGGLS